MTRTWNRCGSILAKRNQTLIETSVLILLFGRGLCAAHIRGPGVTCPADDLPGQRPSPHWNGLGVGWCRHFYLQQGSPWQYYQQCRPGTTDPDVPLLWPVAICTR